MRSQDDLLKGEALEFIERFQGNCDRCHVNHHLRTRPVDLEWIDRRCLILSLNDVETINEMDVRFLQQALEVQTHWTITPLHMNRLRISFQCNLGPWMGR